MVLGVSKYERGRVPGKVIVAANLPRKELSQTQNKVPREKAHSAISASPSVSFRERELYCPWDFRNVLRNRSVYDMGIRDMSALVDPTGGVPVLQ